MSKDDCVTVGVREVGMRVCVSMHMSKWVCECVALLSTCND